VRGAGKTLYMRTPASLEEITRPNLDLLLSSLVQNESQVIVTDPALKDPITITILYHDDST